MIVIDSDILSLIEVKSPDGMKAQSRMDATGELQTITIVTVEERFRGRLHGCSKAVDPDKYVLAAARLRDTFDDLKARRILDFDDRAAARFRELKTQRIRIGTYDLRIASIVLTHDALLISRNLKDFRKVPNLRVEDWTR